MKQSILFTILLFCISIEMLACLSASQTRLLPIGVVGNDVVALQLVMTRDSYFPDTAKMKNEFDAWWRGTVSLVAFDSKSYKIKKRYYALRFWNHDKDLDAQVEWWYSNAIKAAQTIPHIVQLSPENISMCHFRNDCNLAAFTFNRDSTQLSIRYKPTGNAYDVSELIFTDTNTVIYYIGANAEDYYAAAMLRDKSTAFEIGSLRLFSVGDRKLLVLHIGFGHKLEPAEGTREELEPEYTPKYPKFDKIENCAYHQPILHHGTGLDLPIWLN